MELVELSDFLVHFICSLYVIVHICHHTFVIIMLFTVYILNILTCKYKKIPKIHIEIYLNIKEYILNVL